MSRYLKFRCIRYLHLDVIVFRCNPMMTLKRFKCIFLLKYNIWKINITQLMPRSCQTKYHISERGKNKAFKWNMISNEKNEGWFSLFSVVYILLITYSQTLLFEDKFSTILNVWLRFTGFIVSEWNSYFTSIFFIYFQLIYSTCSSFLAM